MQKGRGPRANNFRPLPMGRLYLTSGRKGSPKCTKIAPYYSSSGGDWVIPILSRVGSWISDYRGHPAGRRQEVPAVA